LVFELSVIETPLCRTFRIMLLRIACENERRKRI